MGLIVESFNSWVITDLLITENIAAAKSFMIRMEADRLRIEPRDMTPDQTARVLANKDYKQIVQMVQAQPGYTSAFVKFYFKQGISLPNLLQLATDIRTKPNIVRQLPKNVEQYADQEKVGHITGFEELQDTLADLEKTDKAKWLVNKLPREIRDKYRSATPELKKRFVNLANTLSSLGEDIIKLLMQTISSFKTWEFERIVNHIDEFTAAYNTLDINKKIDEVSRFAPEAAILFVDNKTMVISLRTEEAQKALCAVAITWCINKSSFSYYADNRVQLGIFDFSKSSSNNMFLIGMTINNNGTFYSGSDLNNAAYHHTTDPFETLKVLGYSQELVNTVKEAFPTEVIIKRTVTQILQNEKIPMDLLRAVIRKSQFIDDMEQVDPLIMDVLVHIINNRIARNISRDTIIDMYKKYGIISNFSKEMLKKAVPDITVEEIEEINAATLKNSESAQGEIANRMNSAMALEPEAGIIYHDSHYLVLSGRTRKVEQELIGKPITIYTIEKKPATFFILNFKLDREDPYFVSKLTIDSRQHAISFVNAKGNSYSNSNSIINAYGNGTAISRDTLKDLVVDSGYPQLIADSIYDKLENELVISSVLYDLGLDTQNASDVLSAIIKKSYMIDPAEKMEETTESTILKIINNKLKNILSREQVISLYNQHGVLCKFSALVLTSLIPDLTNTEKGDILLATVKMFNVIDSVIAIGKTKVSQEMKNILKQKDEIYTELGVTDRDAIAISEGYSDSMLAEPAVKPTVKPPKTKPNTPSKPGPIPTRQPHKTPEPAKAEADDVIKRLEALNGR